MSVFEHAPNWILFYSLVFDATDNPIKSNFNSEHLRLPVHVCTFNSITKTNWIPYELT